MDFDRLRTLRELALRGTMASVAESLHLSPSAVSQQIATLEHEVSARLVEKRGRGVAMTPAGLALVSRSDRIFEEVQAAKADIERLRSAVAGELRVAAFPSVAAFLLPRAMRALLDEHPQLSIMFDEMEPDEGLTALRSWQTDVAIIDDRNVATGSIDKNVQTMPLMRDRFLVMMSARHPLAAESEVTLHQLQDERWIVDTASSIYTRMLVEACRTEGYDPVISARCKGFEVCAAMIRENLGIAFLPGLRATNALEGIKVLPLRPALARNLFLAFRRGQQDSPSINAFSAAVRRIAEERGEASSGIAS